MGVGHVETDRQSPRALVQMRMDERHSALEHTVWKSGCGSSDRLADAQKGQLILIKLSLDPDRGQAGHEIESRALVDVIPLQSIFANHMTLDGRANLYMSDRLAVAFDLSNLIVVHAQEPQF